MFTFDELCSLIRVVSETGVGGVEVERDGMRVRVDGVPVAPVAPVQAGAPLIPPQVIAGMHLQPAARFAGQILSSRRLHMNWDLLGLS